MGGGTGLRLVTVGIWVLLVVTTVTLFLGYRDSTKISNNLRTKRSPGLHPHENRAHKDYYDHDDDERGTRSRKDRIKNGGDMSMKGGSTVVQHNSTAPESIPGTAENDIHHTPPDDGSLPGLTKGIPQGRGFGPRRHGPKEAGDAIPDAIQDSSTPLPKIEEREAIGIKNGHRNESEVSNATKDTAKPGTPGTTSNPLSKANIGDATGKASDTKLRSNLKSGDIGSSVKSTVNTSKPLATTAANNKSNTTGKDSDKKLEQGFANLWRQSIVLPNSGSQASKNSTVVKGASGLPKKPAESKPVGDNPLGGNRNQSAALTAKENVGYNNSIPDKRQEEGTRLKMVNGKIVSLPPKGLPGSGGDANSTVQGKINYSAKDTGRPRTPINSGPYSKPLGSPVTILRGPNTPPETADNKGNKDRNDPNKNMWRQSVVPPTNGSQASKNATAVKGDGDSPRKPVPSKSVGDKPFSENRNDSKARIAKDNVGYNNSVPEKFQDTMKESKQRINAKEPSSSNPRPPNSTDVTSNGLTELKLHPNESYPGTQENAGSTALSVTSKLHENRTELLLAVDTRHNVRDNPLEMKQPKEPEKISEVLGQTVIANDTNVGPVPSGTDSTHLNIAKPVSNSSAVSTEGQGDSREKKIGVTQPLPDGIPPMAVPEDKKVLPAKHAGDGGKPFIPPGVSETPVVDKHDGQEPNKTAPTETGLGEAENTKHPFLTSAQVPDESTHVNVAKPGDIVPETEARLPVTERSKELHEQATRDENILPNATSSIGISPSKGELVEDQVARLKDHHEAEEPSPSNGVPLPPKDNTATEESGNNSSSKAATYLHGDDPTSNVSIVKMSPRTENGDQQRDGLANKTFENDYNNQTLNPGKGTAISADDKVVHDQATEEALGKKVPNVEVAKSSHSGGNSSEMPGDQVGQSMFGRNKHNVHDEKQKLPVTPNLVRKLPDGARDLPPESTESIPTVEATSPDVNMHPKSGEKGTSTRGTTLPTLLDQEPVMPDVKTPLEPTQNISGEKQQPIFHGKSPSNKLSPEQGQSVTVQPESVRVGNQVSMVDGELVNDTKLGKQVSMVNGTTVHRYDGKRLSKPDVRNVPDSNVSELHEVSSERPFASGAAEPPYLSGSKFEGKSSGDGWEMREERTPSSIVGRNEESSLDRREPIVGKLPSMLTTTEQPNVGASKVETKASGLPGVAMKFTKQTTQLPPPDAGTPSPLHGSAVHSKVPVKLDEGLPLDWRPNTGGTHLTKQWPVHGVTPSLGQGLSGTTEVSPVATQPPGVDDRKQPQDEGKRTLNPTEYPNLFNGGVPSSTARTNIGGKPPEGGVTEPSNQLSKGDTHPLKGKPEKGQSVGANQTSKLDRKNKPLFNGKRLSMPEVRVPADSDEFELDGKSSENKHEKLITGGTSSTTEISQPGNLSHDAKQPSTIARKRLSMPDVRGPPDSNESNIDGKPLENELQLPVSGNRSSKSATRRKVVQPDEGKGSEGPHDTTESSTPSTEVTSLNESSHSTLDRYPDGGNRGKRPASDYAEPGIRVTQIPNTSRQKLQSFDGKPSVKEINSSVEQGQSGSIKQEEVGAARTTPTIVENIPPAATQPPSQHKLQPQPDAAQKLTVTEHPASLDEGEQLNLNGSIVAGERSEGQLEQPIVGGTSSSPEVNQPFTQGIRGANRTLEKWHSATGPVAVAREHALPSKLSHDAKQPYTFNGKPLSMPDVRGPPDSNEAELERKSSEDGSQRPVNGKGSSKSARRRKVANVRNESLSEELPLGPGTVVPTTSAGSNLDGKASEGGWEVPRATTEPSRPNTEVQLSPNATIHSKSPAKEIQSSLEHSQSDTVKEVELGVDRTTPATVENIPPAVTHPPNLHGNKQQPQPDTAQKLAVTEHPEFFDESEQLNLNASKVSGKTSGGQSEQPISGKTSSSPEINQAFIPGSPGDNPKIEKWQSTTEPAVDREQPNASGSNFSSDTKQPPTFTGKRLSMPDVRGPADSDESDLTEKPAEERWELPVNDNGSSKSSVRKKLPQKSKPSVEQRKSGAEGEGPIREGSQSLALVTVSPVENRDSNFGVTKQPVYSDKQKELGPQQEVPPIMEGRTDKSYPGINEGNVTPVPAKGSTERNVPSAIENDKLKEGMSSDKAIPTPNPVTPSEATSKRNIGEGMTNKPYTNFSVIPPTEEKEPSSRAQPILSQVEAPIEVAKEPSLSEKVHSHLPTNDVGLIHSKPYFNGSTTENSGRMGELDTAKAVVEDDPNTHVSESNKSMKHMPTLPTQDENSIPQVKDDSDLLKVKKPAVPLEGHLGPEYFTSPKPISSDNGDKSNEMKENGKPWKALEAREPTVPETGVNEFKEQPGTSKVLTAKPQLLVSPDTNGSIVLQPIMKGADPGNTEVDSKVSKPKTGKNETAVPSATDVAMSNQTLPTSTEKKSPGTELPVSGNYEQPSVSNLKNHVDAGFVYPDSDKLTKPVPTQDIVGDENSISKVKDDVDLLKVKKQDEGDIVPAYFTSPKPTSPDHGDNSKEETKPSNAPKAGEPIVPATQANGIKLQPGSRKELVDSIASGTAKPELLASPDTNGSIVLQPSMQGTGHGNAEGDPDVNTLNKTGTTMSNQTLKAPSDKDSPGSKLKLLIGGNETLASNVTKTVDPPSVSAPKEGKDVLELNRVKLIDQLSTGTEASHLILGKYNVTDSTETVTGKPLNERDTRLPTMEPTLQDPDKVLVPYTTPTNDQDTTNPLDSAIVKDQPPPKRPKSLGRSFGRRFLNGSRRAVTEGPQNEPGTATATIRNIVEEQTTPTYIFTSKPDREIYDDQAPIVNLTNQPISSERIDNNERNNATKPKNSTVHRGRTMIRKNTRTKDKLQDAEAIFPWISEEKNISEPDASKKEKDTPILNDQTTKKVTTSTTPKPSTTTTTTRTTPKPLKTTTIPPKPLGRGMTKKKKTKTRKEKGGTNRAKEGDDDDGNAHLLGLLDTSKKDPVGNGLLGDVTTLLRK